MPVALAGNLLVSPSDTDRDQILGLGHLSHVANAFSADPSFPFFLFSFFPFFFFSCQLLCQLAVWTQELSIFGFSNDGCLPLVVPVLL